MTALSRAINLMQDALQGIAAVWVVYERPGLGSVRLKARQGNTGRNVQAADEMYLDANRADWLVRSADLRIAGQQITPAPGDRVIVTLQGRARKYDVTPPSESESYFSPSDPEGREWRIHTRLGEGTP